MNVSQTNLKDESLKFLNHTGLDVLRQRLHQLSTSLTALNHRLHTEYPLPPYPSLLASFNAILAQFTIVKDALQKMQDELLENAVIPMEFPVRVHEGMLLTMMRSKPEPYVDEWIAQGKAYSEANPPGKGIPAGKERDEDDDDKDEDEEEEDEDEDTLWKFAAAIVATQIDQLNLKAAVQTTKVAELKKEVDETMGSIERVMRFVSRGTIVPGGQPQAQPSTGTAAIYLHMITLIYFVQFPSAEIP
ncbi:hypothetical protein G7K_3470-t1 [Saitoella complicata NRRL Y-17804]|uniref:Mediator of RNA polymerase II transcription subunit 8 n=1 Tax=Saitoella complicata (strain BCRC 22490 / CBS 7301 / JCM 7358 / NBRC 10748 / NRRL Y-17804) TaxID=698492 RepID=A0A0E9NHK1_SAICN|nr:hypothetical protein G7K_3470-t1 [Saitoella complicata NRRL Y-17804]